MRRPWFALILHVKTEDLRMLRVNDPTILSDVPTDDQAFALAVAFFSSHMGPIKLMTDDV